MLSSIPKPYTLNNKEAKNGKQRFSHKTHKKSFLLFVCLCLSFAVLSLSLSLSLSNSLEVWKQTLLLKRRN